MSLIAADAPCPCGSGDAFENCCAPLIAGKAAETPEALMRSRYTAFVVGDVEHLEGTLAASERGSFDRDETKRWAEASEWLGLSILDVQKGGGGDEEGVVEFAARFRLDGEIRTHHEIARFIREDGRWVYLDGRQGARTVRRERPKVGRNEPCPCGSGRKYKKCCGAAA